MDGHIKPGRVGIATDLFRCELMSLDSIATNRNLTYHLFNYPLKKLGFTMEHFAPLSEGGGVDVAAIANAMGVPFDQEGWAIAACAEPSTDILNMYESVQRFDLMVNFGMTHHFVKVLNHFNVPYLNIEVAPQRFCPELFWSASTNHTDIARALSTIAIDEDYFFEEAGRLRAAKSFRNMDYFADPAKRYGVFAAQTLVDLALVSDGKIKTAADFELALPEIFTGVDEVVFAQHPFSANEPALELLKKIFGSVVEHSGGSYPLLSAENVDRVCGLSSSLLKEARYFGKSVTSLVQPDLERDRTTYIVPQSLTSVAFWEAAIQRTDPPRQAPLPTSIDKILGMRWG